jgi:hypothetical protein
MKPEPTVTFPERNSARGRCVSCGEYWKKYERFIQVLMNNKIVRGERYCCGCEHIARINNPTPTRQQAGDQRMAELKARNDRRAAKWHKASEPERMQIIDRRLAKYR